MKEATIDKINEDVKTISLFRRNETPYISIQKGNSTGFLSNKLSRFLGLVDGDYIQFHKHKEHKFCWSFSITQEPLGASKLNYPRSSRVWRFNDVDSINQMCETFNIGKTRVKLYVGIKSYITSRTLNMDIVKQFQIIDVPMQRYDIPESTREAYIEEYTNSITRL